MSEVTLIKRSFPACPACNAMAQALREEGIEFTTLDITEDPSLVDTYEIQGIPVTLAGEKKFVGFTHPDLIKQAIEGGR